MFVQKTVERSSSVRSRLLDERRAEREIGEDEHEARRDEHHSRYAVVVGREEPCEQHGRDEPRDLEDHGRAELPRDTAHDAALDQLRRRFVHRSSSRSRRA